MSNRALGALLAVLLCICGFLGFRIWALTGGSLASKAEPVPVGTTVPDASRSFIAAWERSETATYMARMTVGLTANGVAASTEDVLVRRNGQKLINRDSSIIYERDGVTETCRPTAAELFCTPTEAVPTVEERLDELEDLVTGEAPRYSVRFGSRAGCYNLKLDLSRGSIVPRFGLSSRYCFDSDTGAITESTVERVNRTETSRASDISDTLEESELLGVFPEPILQQFLK